MRPTQYIRVREIVPLIAPRALKQELPMTEAANRTVLGGREAVQRILQGEDRRLLVVAGPCSIHDPKAALEYAGRLNGLRREVEDRLVVLMRVYFEKPRTTIGWKGLINDPGLDGSCDIETGLRLARRLLLALGEMGLPAATETLDPITPQYIADLVSWSAIGARTTESQTHREMASGLSMPVGYKNSTEGSLQAALDAMHSARHPHGFVGIDPEGRTCIVRTTGNPWGHLILRGGRARPNYDPESIRAATQALRDAGLPPALMVDCSHANSGRRHERQEVVWRSILDQRAAGNEELVGLMLESNLVEGSQKIPNDLSTLRYGVSITDACIGWEKTEELLRHACGVLAPPAARSAVAG